MQAGHGMAGIGKTIGCTVWGSAHLATAQRTREWWEWWEWWEGIQHGQGELVCAESAGSSGDDQDFRKDCLQAFAAGAVGCG
jgi:hypothetical protein